MHFTNRGKSIVNYGWVLVGLVLGLVLSGSSEALAQAPVRYEELRSIDTQDLDLLHPTGLAFSPTSNTFFILPGRPDPPLPQDTTTIVTLSPYEDLIDTIGIPAGGIDPLNVAFDSQANRLLLFDSGANDLIEIEVGPYGLLDPTRVSRIEAQQFGVQDVQGLTFDGQGRLFILDGMGPRLVRIEPDPTAGLEGGQVSEIELQSLGLTGVRGLAFNPADNHLYVLNPTSHTLHELTESGQRINSHALDGSEINELQGLVFAPSRDATDDPTNIHLYVADSGQRADGTQPPAAGRIIEFSITEVGSLGPLAETVQAILVKTTATSLWSPPSPDPMGIGYLPAANRLLLVDSEVEEDPKPYWQGVNIFEISRSGNLIQTHTTFTANPIGLIPNNFSAEPTGVAVNPANGHYFFSDDNLDKVIEVNLGSDGLYGTSDDIVTSFSTNAFGSLDSEGLAFDSWQGHLYVVDGVNIEVYHIAPGINGIFDGIPPAGDDQVTSFDGASLGLVDPEGITFSPDTGYLYILSAKADLIAETTTSGVLLRTIDISTFSTVRPSDLAYAPASNNSGAKRIYLADRAIDNGQDPNENDGKMYEIAFPPPTGLKRIYLPLVVK